MTTILCQASINDSHSQQNILLTQEGEQFIEVSEFNAYLYDQEVTQHSIQPLFDNNTVILAKHSSHGVYPQSQMKAGKLYYVIPRYWVNTPNNGWDLVPRMRNVNRALRGQSYFSCVTGSVRH